MISMVKFDELSKARVKFYLRGPVKLVAAFVLTIAVMGGIAYLTTGEAHAAPQATPSVSNDIGCRQVGAYAWSSVWR